ncbi:hypothetical protein F442_19606 [Phytophthora nicotianae P10297]|uniref:Uncharacterized protein n=1 Tax=Phytophthora nicotianae P10297 TaxID=1317064 RepID=W2YA85_PHYNI|nr:hypothetical protein F442_19606 [Phytophthora nicotianae P10297]
MPPKKPNKTLVDESTATAAADYTAPDDPIPTAISLVSDSPSTTKHMRSARSTSTPKSVGYESPLKKLRKTMGQHTPRKIIDTIDSLRNFIKDTDVGNKQIRDSIRIQARLLWFTPETIGEYHFLRLYLGEQQAPEPLRQQQREFQAAQRDDPFETNQYLITLSLYEVSPDDPHLPAPGSVISFSPTKLSIYRNCCQVNAKLSAITIINEP